MERFVSSPGRPAPADRLRTVPPAHLMRILLRDVLGVATLAGVTEELSNLADAILDWRIGVFRGVGGAAREPRLKTAAHAASA